MIVNLKSVLNLFIVFFILSFSFSSLGVNKTLKSNSIFNLDSTWTSHQKKPVSLKQFLGKQTLIAMVYTSCQHTCPLITSKIQQMEKKIGQQDMNIVLVSFDPKRDTPEHLNTYFQKMKLNSNWFLLTGNEPDIRSLAAVLGVSYKKDKEGEFSHSNIITLLDTDGVIKAQLRSLSEDINVIVNQF